MSFDIARITQAKRSSDRPLVLANLVEYFTFISRGANVRARSCYPSVFRNGQSDTAVSSEICNKIVTSHKTGIHLGRIIETLIKAMGTFITPQTGLCFVRDTGSGRCSHVSRKFAEYFRVAREIRMRKNYFCEYFQGRSSAKVIGERDADRWIVRQGTSHWFLGTSISKCGIIEKRARCQAGKEYPRGLWEARSSKTFGEGFVRNWTWQSRQRPTAKSWFTKRHFAARLNRRKMCIFFPEGTITRCIISTAESLGRSFL